MLLPLATLCVTCSDLRRAGKLGAFVHLHLSGDCCHISSDGGRVCRPLIICDAGVPRVKQAGFQQI